MYYTYQNSTEYTLIWVTNASHRVKFNYVFVNSPYYEFD